MSTGRTSRDNAPVNEAGAAEVLARAPVPGPVLAVAADLQAAGHAAVLVGGAVRDALLGLAVADWDVASSATPEEVIKLFRRTIPTGVQHGTVTVLVRGTAGGAAEPVEVTTFRGEGEYTDGRRPARVEFHRSLERDLARRDFTINAFAWDPVARVFADPFGGLRDLRAGIVRAVGDAPSRFTEDGLRTMRAVRFCATHAMVLDPATAAGIPPALPILDKVSRERVRVELYKLLGAEVPSRGLRPMADTGIWPHVLPEIPDTAKDAAIAAVDRMPADPIARLARLLWPLVPEPGGVARITAAIDDLRPSRDERRVVLALCSDATRALEAAGHDPVAIRRAASSLGREHLPRALDMLGPPPEHRAAIEAACEGVALSPGELSVKGGDLVSAGIVPRGPRVGEVLRALLEEVLADPSRNEPSALLSRARELAGH
jgi:tRNA nucleotidyltransferase (CCA-adding enzyme)